MSRVSIEPTVEKLEMIRALYAKYDRLFDSGALRDKLSPPMRSKDLLRAIDDTDFLLGKLAEGKSSLDFLEDLNAQLATYILESKNDESRDA